MERSLAENPKRLLILCSAIFFAIAIWLAYIKVYWFDELITLYIVRGHTVQSVWSALRAGVDQNPPLNHLLTLPLHMVFGDSPIAMRLPGMVAFWIAGVAAYLFLRRRVPALFALGAVLYLGATRAFDYSFDARSYGLLMACGMVALLSWQKLVEGQNRRLAFAGLALALAAGISSHYYAVLLFAPIAAGELVRTARTRKIDFAVWVALAVGALPLIVYWPLIRVDMRLYTAYAWNAPRLGFLWSGYEALLEETIWPVMALFAAATVLWFIRRNSNGDKRMVPEHEMAAIITLIGLPLIAYALAVIKTGQVSSRYVLPSAFGVALAVGIAAVKVSRQKAVAGIAFCLVALSWSVVRTSLMARELLERREQFTAFISQPALRGELPILCGDSMTVLPLNYYGDAELRRRLMFPIDLQAVRAYQKEDSAEQTLYAGRGTVFPVDEEDLRVFRQRHSTYLVMSNEQGWLVKTLRANGVALREMIDRDKFYNGQVDPLFRMRPQLWISEEQKPVTFLSSTVLPGQDTDCKDTMRIEAHWPHRAIEIGKARAFLWQHWSEKKCGELFLTSWSREGVRGDSRYKIGLVQDAMLLTVNLSSAEDPSAPVDGLAVPASGSLKRTAPESTSYLAYSVERVKPEVPYDVATAKVIESTESLPSSKYRLRFKDKDGKVITDF